MDTARNNRMEININIIAKQQRLRRRSLSSGSSPEIKAYLQRTGAGALSGADGVSAALAAAAASAALGESAKSWRQQRGMAASKRASGEIWRHQLRKAQQQKRNNRPQRKIKRSAAHQTAAAQSKAKRQLLADWRQRGGGSKRRRQRCSGGIAKNGENGGNVRISISSENNAMAFEMAANIGAGVAPCAPAGCTLRLRGSRAAVKIWRRWTRGANA